jgi:hypothetical protein
LQRRRAKALPTAQGAVIKARGRGLDVRATVGCRSKRSAQFFRNAARAASDLGQNHPHG